MNLRNVQRDLEKWREGKKVSSPMAIPALSEGFCNVVLLFQEGEGGNAVL